MEFKILFTSFGNENIVYMCSKENFPNYTLTWYYVS